MTATAPAMTLQVRDREKVMEPHRLHARAQRFQESFHHCLLAK
jgi:hypothetical protein